MSQRTKVVGTRSFIVWMLIIVAVIMIAALAVGGLVVYPRLQEQRAEQARLAQAEQHYQAGVAFQNVSDWGAAEAEFKQAISIDANYKDVQARLAEVKTRLAESRTTATATAVETHYQKALAYINLERWIEAQMELQAVFETDPNYKDVQALWAVVIPKLTPTATPSPSVTPTPEYTPTPTLTPLERRLHELEQRLDEAWQKEDWETAIGLIEQILAINPGYDDMTEKLYAAHVNYGRQLAAEGKLEEAKMEFTRALDVKPDGEEAMEELEKLMPVSP
jgi:tetratricopeptide (TPR) repeat protein